MGGALETVVPFDIAIRNKNASGVFFKEQTAAALNEAVRLLEENEDCFTPAVIRQNALRFNRQRFKDEIREYVAAKCVERTGNAKAPAPKIGN